MLFHTSNPASHTFGSQRSCSCNRSEFEGGAQRARNAHRNTVQHCSHCHESTYYCIISTHPGWGIGLVRLLTRNMDQNSRGKPGGVFPLSPTAVLVQVYCFTYSLTSFPQSCYPRDVDVGVDIVCRPAWTRWKTSRASSSWRTRKKS